MIWNFTLNNTVTYGDQRLRGCLCQRALRFMVICGIGAVSNVGVASFIYAQDNVWWIAGLGGARDGRGVELRREFGVRLAAALKLFGDRRIDPSTLIACMHTLSVQAVLR